MTSSLKRSLTVVSVAAVAALTLAACGSGGGSNSTSSSAPAPTSSSAPAPTSSSAPAPGPHEAAAAIVDPLKAAIAWPAPAQLSKPVNLKGKTIWWIPIIDAVPVIHGFGEGFKQAVEAVGGTVKLCDGKANPADIGACMQQAADAPADAVVTAFIDYAMLPAAFDALTAKNIPVLVGGEAPSGGKENGPLLAFNDPSAHVNKMYETLGAMGILNGGDAPNGLFLKLMDSSLTTNASNAGIAAWTALCADCPIVGLEYNTPNADKIPSAVAAELTKNPDINVIMVPVDSFVAPVQAALDTAGVQIPIVSTGGDLPNMQMVKDGKQAGDLGTPVIYTGWSYANSLFQLLVGDAVTPETALTNRFFDSSNVADLQLTPEGYNSNAWYGDDSYQAAYKAAWGLMQ